MKKQEYVFYLKKRNEYITNNQGTEYHCFIKKPEDFFKDNAGLKNIETNLTVNKQQANYLLDNKSRIEIFVLEDNTIINRFDAQIKDPTYKSNEISCSFNLVEKPFINKYVPIIDKNGNIKIITNS